MLLQSSQTPSDGPGQECCLFVYISSMSRWFHLSQWTGWFTEFIQLFTHRSVFRKKAISNIFVSLRATVRLLYIIVIV